MTLFPAFYSLVMLVGMFSQRVDTEGNRIEKMCGQVLLVENIPDKKHSRTYSERSKPAKKATVRLFKKRVEAACCESEVLIAEAITKGNGKFEFKSALPGTYWVVVLVGGRKYKLAVNYSRDTKMETRCSDILFEITNGELYLGRLIQVD